MSGSAKQREKHTVSRLLADGTHIELLFDADAHTTKFAVWREGHLSVESHVDLDAGVRLVPFSADNNLIATNAVLLPSGVVEYESEARLTSEIEAFIHRYADLSPPFEKVCAAYVLLSWLYDAFGEVPYLRLRGDFGTGKTRTLQTVGSLCYKPFFASGASTVSPIFHTLDAFRGTLVFDEADFRFSDERAEIVKILNNGNVRGMPVLRTIVNRQHEFNPRAFQVFGPKIVATRGNYEDKGLESRFFAEQMGSRRLRTDIPINLPSEFAGEALELRNKLLLYRFRNWAKARLKEELLEPQLEPRFNQMLLPLLSVATDEEMRDAVRETAYRAQWDMKADRSLAAEAQVLEVLAERMIVGEGAAVPIAEICRLLNERHGFDYARPITNRWIGQVLRKRLGISSYKSHGVYVVPLSERVKIDLLCAKYDVSVPDTGGSEVQSGDVGTSGTL